MRPITQVISAEEDNCQIAVAFWPLALPLNALPCTLRCRVADADGGVPPTDLDLPPGRQSALPLRRDGSQQMSFSVADSPDWTPTFALPQWDPTTLQMAALDTVGDD